MAAINTLIEIVQEPGGAKNFTPLVYFLIITVSYLFSTCAILLIIKNNIGNPIEVKGLERESLRTRMFPEDAGKVSYWMAISIWNNFLVYCVLQIILPYVAVNTGAVDEGANWLQWGYAILSIGSLCGTLASYSAVTGSFALTETTVLLTGFSIPILMAGFGIGNFTGSAAQTFLNICLGLSGAISGWQIPLIFRDCCETYPSRASELTTYLSYWLVVLFMVAYGIEGVIEFAGY